MERVGEGAPETLAADMYLVSVSKLLESTESVGFKGGGLIRGGVAGVDA